MFVFLENGNITSTFPVRPMEEKEISNLEYGTYRFCVFNAYFEEVSSIPDEFCKIVSLKAPERIVPTLPEERIVEKIEEQIALMPTSAGNIQFIIVILVAALALVFVTIVVAALLWRKRRFLHLKNSSINRNAPHVDESSKLSYCSKLISTSLSKPDLTMDASKEFAVTLMLRPPPQSECQNRPHPLGSPFPSHFGHIGGGQTELFDVNRNNSSRADASLYIWSVHW